MKERAEEFPRTMRRRPVSPSEEKVTGEKRGVLDRVGGLNRVAADFLLGIGVVHTHKTLP